MLKMGRITYLYIAGLMALASPCWASTINIIPTDASDAIVNIVYNQVPITYIDKNGSTVGTLQGSIATESQTALTASLAFSYSAVDYSGGLRFSDTITNNTATDWSNYTLTLSPGFFFPLSTFPIPGFASISGTTVTGLNPTLGSVSNSPSNVFSISFNSPLLIGQSFSLHIPVEGLPSLGTFTLTEAATAVPEPATQLLLGSGLGFLGLAARRRKKA